MADFPDIPTGYGLPLVNLDTDLLPAPTMTALDARYPGSAAEVAALEELVEEGRLSEPELSATFVARRVHLVILAGQSNMSGRGADYSTFKDPAHPRIMQFGSGASAITAATEPLDMHDTPSGIGPGLQFAREWIADLPDDDVIVLVPTAHGSTPLVSNATLGWRYGVSGGLTALAIAQAIAAKAAAEALYAGAQVSYAGVLWFQGETDSAPGVAVTGAAYDTDLRALIAGFRSSLSTPLLPWIGMAFVPEAMDVGTRAQVQGVQSALPFAVAATGFVEPIPNGYSNGDALHANADAHRLFYGPRAYEEFRRIRGYRAAVNADLSVDDPPVLPTEGATIWTDTFTAADGATRTATDTGGFSWATAAADGVNASTFGIKGNAGAIYRAAGTTSLFATVDSGEESRWIIWDFTVQGTANVRPVFCYGGPGQHYAILANAAAFSVRRYDTDSTYVILASATIAHTDETALEVKALIHRPDLGSGVAYLSIWVAGSLVVNTVTISSYIDNTKDGLSFITSSGSDSTRLGTITTKAVA